MTAQELFVEYGRDAEVVKSASISDDGLYRYRLTRAWADGPRMTFVMLNPSIADAEVDDPTIRRCMGFARRENCGGIVVVNLFALRVTRPVHLFDGTIAKDANGPDNVEAVGTALAEARANGWPIVAAWGDIGSKCIRSTAYGWHFTIGDPHVLCLGKTKHGWPRHPLYVKASQRLEAW